MGRSVVVWLSIQCSGLAGEHLQYRPHHCRAQPGQAPLQLGADRKTRAGYAGGWLLEILNPKVKISYYGN
jgi:hypothetical protein